MPGTSPKPSCSLIASMPRLLEPLSVNTRLSPRVLAGAPTLSIEVVQLPNSGQERLYTVDGQLIGRGPERIGGRLFAEEKSAHGF
jgi:hypothetical protein